MRQLAAVIGGLTIGAAVMLAILQPWKQEEKPKPPPPPLAPPPADRLADARRLIDDGKIEEARAILNRESPSALGFALLALADLHGPDLRSARDHLSKAATLNPNLFEIALFQGHLDMLAGDRAAAVRSYTEALKRKADAAGALGGRAAARFGLKEYAGAIEDATAALAADPNDPGALFTRAAAYKELGRNEESLRDWTAYLTRRPTDAQAWMNRGNVHARMGRKSGAVTDWEQAMTLDLTLREQLEPLINEAKN